MAYLDIFYLLHCSVTVFVHASRVTFPLLHCIVPSSNFSAFRSFFLFVTVISLPLRTIAFAPSSFLVFTDSSHFPFSIVVYRQWLAPKLLRALPRLLVHSLPPVHLHRPQRALPPRRAHNLGRRSLHKTTRKRTSGLPSTYSLKHPVSSQLITSPPC